MNELLHALRKSFDKTWTEAVATEPKCEKTANVRVAHGNITTLLTLNNWSAATFPTLHVWIVYLCCMKLAYTIAHIVIV